MQRPPSLKPRLQIFRKMNPTLRPSKVVETGVYVKDLERAQRFYGDVLSLELYTRQEGRHVFFKAGKSMLLLFNADTTLKEKQTPHGASGSQHFAFQVDESDLDAWRVRLREKGVAIESEVDWPAGGHSIYFRDPDQNLVELITQGLWPVED